MNSGMAATGADHLHVGVVGRPVVVADQGRQLLPQREHLLEQRLRGRPAALAEHGHQVPPDVLVVREHPHRDRVGVVGRDRDQPVIAGRVGGEPVLGQAGEPLGGDPDRADVVAGDLVELLVELGQPVADRRDPGPGLLVAVDTRPPEVLAHLLEQPGRQRVIGDRRWRRAPRTRRTGRGPGSTRSPAAAPPARLRPRDRAPPRRGGRCRTTSRSQRRCRGGRWPGPRRGAPPAGRSVAPCGRCRSARAPGRARSEERDLTQSPQVVGSSVAGQGEGFESHLATLRTGCQTSSPRRRVR